jgi:hypothetical protein
VADEESSDQDDQDDRPIVGTSLRLLGLSVRTFNWLTRADINTIEELDRWSDRELLKLKNFGRAGVAEARAAAARWRGQDHVERIAHYLRRNLPLKDRERLATMLTIEGDERAELGKGEAVPAVGHAMAYLDRQTAGTIDRRTLY